MEQLRPVSRTERILFPIISTIACGLVLPAAVPLIGMLMFGNLLRECGCTDRLSQAAQNEVLNATTIFLGISVGGTMNADTFLTVATIKIIFLGLVAFIFSTAGGVIFGQVMKVMSGGKSTRSSALLASPPFLWRRASARRSSRKSSPVPTCLCTHGPERRRSYRYRGRGGRYAHAARPVIQPADGNSI